MRRSDRTVVLAAGLALALGAAGCGHHVDSGPYRFTQSAVDRDTCKLIPTDGGLWSGTLTTTGEQVTVEFALPGVQSPERMVGFFKSPEFGKPDGFLVDGSDAKVATPVPEACVADTVQMHIDGTIVDDTHLSGLLQVTWALTPLPPGNACDEYVECDLEARFTADLVP